MDINKIISDSLDKSTKDVIDKKFKENNYPDKGMSSLIKQNEFLMNYSNNLLIEYHKALKSELSKQGINI